MHRHHIFIENFVFVITFSLHKKTMKITSLLAKLCVYKFNVILQICGNSLLDMLRYSIEL